MSTYELDDDLVRAFCDQHVSPHDRLVEQLRPQLPARPIEEGCRVLLASDTEPHIPGTCGKPFHDFVLVRWEGNWAPSRIRVDALVRID